MIITVSGGLIELARAKEKQGSSRETLLQTERVVSDSPLLSPLVLGGAPPPPPPPPPLSDVLDPSLLLYSCDLHSETPFRSYADPKINWDKNLSLYGN